MTLDRQILRHKVSGARYRVIQLPPKVWLMPISRAKGWPRQFDHSSIDTSPNGEYEVEEEEEQIRGGALTDASFARANNLYEIYKPLFLNPSTILYESTRGAAVKLLCESNPAATHTTAYKVMRKWLRGGCVVPALADMRGAGKRSGVPKVSTSGVREMDYQSAVRAAQAQSLKIIEKGRRQHEQTDHRADGRPRKRSAPIVQTQFKVGKSALRVFYKFYKECLENPGDHLPATHDRMCKEVFSTQTPDGLSHESPHWAIPSFHQFEHWYYELTTFKERQLKKTGNKDWNLNKRSKLQQAITNIYTAGLVGSLDATIYPIELVSGDESAFPIGTAVVFRIRCRDTGDLIGISVSLEAASWLTAASCIANCNEDKVEFCRSIGIEIKRSDWDIVGLTATIEGDCGETHNSKPDRFITTTNTGLRNIQAGRGDLKPGIEGDWNVLQVSLSGMTPGAIIKSYTEKTGKQWRIEARMTLRAFMQVLILEELKKMHRPRPTLVLPKEFIAAGVDSSPRSMWNYCVTHRGGGLRVFDQTKVRLSLLPTEKGSITEQGVKFRELLYLLPPDQENFAYERARARGRRSVLIGFDERLVDKVYLLEGPEKNPTRYIECTLNTSRQDQKGLSGKTFREVRLLRAEGRSLNTQQQLNVKEITSEWTQMQAQIVAGEKARVSAIRARGDVSATRMERERSAAREREKEKISPDQALTPKASSDVVPVESVKPQESIASKPSRRSSLAERAAAMLKMRRRDD